MRLGICQNIRRVEGETQSESRAKVPFLADRCRVDRNSLNESAPSIVTFCNYAGKPRKKDCFGSLRAR